MEIKFVLGELTCQSLPVLVTVAPMEINFVLDELTCQSIPVLIAVATVSRCPLLPVVRSLDSDGGVENQRGDQVCTR